jgi:RecJ-like exonuclease
MDKDGKGTGRWHYTCMNDGQVWAVGHCSSWECCPDCEAQGVRMYSEESQKCPTCKGRGIVDNPNPCPGHATPEEAEQHYKDYLIEKSTITGPKQQEWPKHKCAVEGCNNEGNHLANVDAYHYYELCAEHADKNTLQSLVRVGESWES